MRSMVVKLRVFLERCPADQLQTTRCLRHVAQRIAFWSSNATQNAGGVLNESLRGECALGVAARGSCHPAVLPGRHWFGTSRDDDEAHPPGTTEEPPPTQPSSDDEWPVLHTDEQDDLKGPPSYSEVQALREEAKGISVGERRKFAAEVAEKYQKAFQLSIVYFRVHHRDLTLPQLSEMIHQFSELIPDERHREWAMTLCSETLLHLLQSFWEKVKEMQSLDPGLFSSAISAIGRFGVPLQRYCIESDPDHILWKLAHVATSLVPYSSPEMILDMVSGFSQMRVFGEKFLDEVMLYAEINLERFTASDLIQLLSGFERFRYEKCTRLLTKFSHVIIPAVSDLSPEELSHLLWIISSFRWKNVQALNTALLKETEKRIHEFSERPLLSLARHLAATDHFPGDRFVSRFCQDFVSRFRELDNPAIVVRNLVALARLGCRDEEAVRFSKEYILKHDLPLRVCFLVGWSLSILNAFDEHIAKWWAWKMERARNQNTTDLQKRHFYQTTMHIFVLQPELGRVLDVDPHFEMICLRKWREQKEKSRYTSHTALQILVILRELGLQTYRSYYTFGRRFCITIFLRRDFPRRICLFCDEGFSNVRHRLRGPQSWRKEMLEKLGWPILRIRGEEWEVLQTKAEKREFVQERLQQLLAKRIAVAKGVQRQFFKS